jgi:hypothetical protein
MTERLLLVARLYGTLIPIVKIAILPLAIVWMVRALRWSTLQLAIVATVRIGLIVTIITIIAIAMTIIS